MCINIISHLDWEDSARLWTGNLISLLFFLSFCASLVFLIMDLAEYDFALCDV